MEKNKDKPELMMEVLHEAHKIIALGGARYVLLAQMKTSLSPRVKSVSDARCRYEQRRGSWV